MQLALHPHRTKLDRIGQNCRKVTSTIRHSSLGCRSSRMFYFLFFNLDLTDQNKTTELLFPQHNKNMQARKQQQPGGRRRRRDRTPHQGIPHTARYPVSHSSGKGLLGIDGLDDMKFDNKEFEHYQARRAPCPFPSSSCFRLRGSASRIPIATYPYQKISISLVSG